MTGQRTRGASKAKGVGRFKEVYDRARAVQAKYAETHAASRAAKTLIDAFEAEDNPGDTAVDAQWLKEVTPKGNA